MSLQEDVLADLGAYFKLLSKKDTDVSRRTTSFKGVIFFQSSM